MKLFILTLFALLWANIGACIPNVILIPTAEGPGAVSQFNISDADREQCIRDLIDPKSGNKIGHVIAHAHPKGDFPHSCT